ncbi:MAG: DUF5683 domain-containing protein [Bacteroidia bacterium]|nr:DUF5683 domain-containing protein [Bacteroidia bacterium]
MATLSDSTKLPKPSLAAALSAALPGTGQIYNRSYWKTPIVWAGLGITGWLAYHNHRQYLFYRNAYRNAMQNLNANPAMPPENLRLLRESFREDRDIFALIFLGLYLLQIGEAYADAHLKGFRIYAGASPAGICLSLAW